MCETVRALVFGTLRTLHVLSLLFTVVVFMTLMLIENCACYRWGTFPVVAALIMPFAIAISADDFQNGHPYSGVGALIIAAVAYALIRDARKQRGEADL